MVKAQRIDSIVFDLKQSIEDLSYELKQVVEEINELKEKVEKFEKS